MRANSFDMSNFFLGVSFFSFFPSFLSGRTRSGRLSEKKKRKKRERTKKKADEMR